MKRRIAWGRIVVALLVCGISAGIAGLLFARQATNQSGIAAYEQGYWVQAHVEFASNTDWNLLQPWVAHFNSGTVQYQQANWASAEHDFRAALGLRPGGARCMISLNLAWTLEAKGDQQASSGLWDAAKASWQAGRDVLAASGCENRAAPEPDQQTATDQRLADKLAQPQPEDQPPPSTPPSSPSVPPSSQPPSSAASQDPSEAAASRASELDERDRSAEAQAQEQDRAGSLPPNEVPTPW